MTDNEMQARADEAAALLGAEEMSRLVELDGEGETVALSVTAAPAFNASKTPVRLLADRRERWEVLRQRTGTNGAAKADKGISWAEAKARIEADARADGERTDIGAGALDRIAVDFDSRGLLHVAKTEQRNGALVPGSAALPLRAHAFRQLATRAGAPAGYLARLPAGLARACLQHGLATSDADRTGLFRLAAGEVRAIVSGRYGALDDGAVLDATEEALDRRGLLSIVRVSALAVGPRTVLRLTVPTMMRRIGPAERGDIVEGLVDITNGELGNAGFRATGGVFRLVCTNGMRVAEMGAARSVRHVGDARRVAEAAADAIPAALDTAQQAVDMLAAATDRIVERASEAFAGLRLFGLQAPEVKAAADMLAAHRGTTLPADTAGRVSILDSLRDVSAWDVVNAVTESAQRATVERRLAMEDAAGAYLGRAMQ